MHSGPKLSLLDEGSDHCRGVSLPLLGSEVLSHGGLLRQSGGMFLGLKSVPSQEPVTHLLRCMVGFLFFGRPRFGHSRVIDLSQK